MTWMMRSHEVISWIMIIKVRPGREDDESPMEDWVYFPEWKFNKLFSRLLPRFTYEDFTFGFYELKRSDWEALLTTLEEIVEKIDGGCSLATVEYMAGPFEDWEEEKLCDDRRRFVQEVRDTYDDFTRWAREQLELHPTLTVIGL